MLAISPYRQNNINFTSYVHPITNKAGKVVNRGTTSLYRMDLEFDNLVLYLIDKYKDTKKVNVINHACSIGTEVYSFVTMLINKLGSIKAAKKFLPALAKDKVKEHIDIAKEGKYKVDSIEAGFISFFFPNQTYRNYFKQNKKYLDNSTLTVKEKIKKLVTFERGNILKDVQKIDFHNTVLFARNFWPYLRKSDREKLARILSERMDSSSTLIIGEFDRDECKIHKLLESYGFVESSKVRNVFEKKAD